MKSVSGKALCKIVERHGWTLTRITGSHHIYKKEGVSVILSVPVHGNRDLPTGTLKGFLKDANLTKTWNDSALMIVACSTMLRNRCFQSLLNLYCNLIDCD